jgi:hypothetical protein
VSPSQFLNWKLICSNNASIKSQVCKVSLSVSFLRSDKNSDSNNPYMLDPATKSLNFPRFVWKPKINYLIALWDSLFYKKSTLISSLLLKKYISIQKFNPQLKEEHNGRKICEKSQYRKSISQWEHSKPGSQKPVSRY